MLTRLGSRGAAARGLAGPARMLATRVEQMKSLLAEQTALSKALDGADSVAKTKAIVDADPALKATIDKMEAMGSVGSWSWARAFSKPVGEAATVAVTGAGSPAAEEALFRIASGQMLGETKPINLRLAGAKPAVVEELKACEFPLLKGVTTGGNALEGADYALILGGDIAAQAKGLNAASAGVLVAVLGNTNAMAAAKASGLPEGRVTAIIPEQMAGTYALAKQAGALRYDVENVVAWGNGVIDFSHATVNGKWALSAVPDAAVPTGAPSDAHVGHAIVNHMNAWANGTDKWVSMGVPAVDDFGMGTGFFYSVPCVCYPGEYKRVGGVSLTPAVADAMEASRKQILGEVAAAKL